MHYVNTMSCKRQLHDPLDISIMLLLQVTNNISWKWFLAVRQNYYVVKCDE